MRWMSDASSRPVVVGVDGSAIARNAARWAASEAARRGVSLRIVYGDVFALPALPEIPGLPWPKEHQAEVRQEVQRWLARAAEVVAHESPGLELETASCAGTPDRVLIDESQSAGLVVVGDRGMGGFTGLLAGSVAVKVTAHAHSPVVVVRRTDSELPSVSRPVVAGLDGSRSAGEVLAHAFEAAASRQVPLHVVHTWHVAGMDEQALRADVAWEEVRQREERLVAELLAGWTERYPDVAVQRFAGPGAPAAELLERATGAQLLVVGSRGHGGFSGTVLGSTSHTLIHHAGCPVMVVHTGKTK